MKIIKCEVNHRAKVEEIENNLEAMQNTVGGYIEVIFPNLDINSEVVLVCNEEGKLNGSEPNRVLFGESAGEGIVDVIYGTFFLCGTDGEEMADIPEELIPQLLHLMNASSVYWLAKKMNALNEAYTTVRAVNAAIEGEGEGEEETSEN